MSARERRLWLWTAVAVAGVFASLAFSSVLTEALYSQGAAAVAFIATMGLIGLMVVTQGLMLRPRGVEIGIWLGIAALYALTFFRTTMPERSHLVEFGVVAVLLYEALNERKRSGRHVPVPWLLAAAGTTLIGAVDETVQLFLPERVFDPTDMLFNALAAAGAIGAMVVLRWARRRSRAS